MTSRTPGQSSLDLSLTATCSPLLTHRYSGDQSSLDLSALGIPEAADGRASAASHNLDEPGEGPGQENEGAGPLRLSLAGLARLVKLPDVAAAA